MIIGIDFDNTIVSYDSIFYEEAVRRGLVPSTVLPLKSAVREYLRRQKREDLWTDLQGYVYGPGIICADAFPGIKKFLGDCRENGIKTYIVSHKTIYPYGGSKFKLRDSATAWLIANGFLKTLETGLAAEDVFFLNSKQSKLAKINELRCDIFFDDLPEFLGEEGFPRLVTRVLFDPNHLHSKENRFLRISTWDEASDFVMAQRDEVRI